MKKAVSNQIFLKKAFTFVSVNPFQPRCFQNTLPMKISTYLPLLLIFLGLAPFISCHKEGPPTIITGLVTNKTTGEPVAGAYVDCFIRKDDWPSPRTKDHSTYSDAGGNYRLEIPDGYRYGFSNIYQVGFLPYVDPARSIEIRDGEINVVDAALIPTDGFLRLKMHNDLSQNDSLYVQFFSPTRASQPYIGGTFVPSNLPFILPFNGFKEELFALPSEEFATVYWGTKNDPLHGILPFRDSIYLLRNDTVEFNIHF